MSKLIFAALFASTLAFAGCGERAESRDAQKSNQDHSPATHMANNTSINERDRMDGMPNPMDQGQSAGDIEITRSIRQAVVADKTFSVDAKNIKIITLESAVALRGPVATEVEKKQIGAIAEATSGVVKVFNMLDVETATN